MENRQPQKYIVTVLLSVLLALVMMSNVLLPLFFLAGAGVMLAGVGSLIH